MQQELLGKTALVTGGAKRIGAAIALALAEAGVNVVLHYRSSATEVAMTAERARSYGVRVWTFAGDFEHPDAADTLFDHATQQAGPIDYLINSASIFPEQTLLETTSDAVLQNVTVNSIAPFLLSKAFAAQKCEGSIINLLDTMICDYDKRHVPYHLSKQMLFSLTRMMAVEFAPKIRVNAIAPGLILPPAGEDESYLEGLKNSNPLQRYGNPDDVCAALLFLLHSSFITGQVIFVDGGRHMRGKMYD